MQKIIVILKDGTVVDVQKGSPFVGAVPRPISEIDVEIWDYDIEGRDEENLETDEDGVKFDRQTW